MGEYTTRKLILVALALGIAFLGLQVGTANADSTSGCVFFTTFAGGTNVSTDTHHNFNGTTFTLGTPTGIAATNGADGLLFAPDGNLIIAGQGTDLLHEITTGGLAVNTVDAGTGAYHLGAVRQRHNFVHDVERTWQRRFNCHRSDCSIRRRLGGRWHSLHSFVRSRHHLRHRCPRSRFRSR